MINLKIIEKEAISSGDHLNSLLFGTELILKVTIK
jgi:hypothetical protein